MKKTILMILGLICSFSLLAMGIEQNIKLFNKLNTDLKITLNGKIHMQISPQEGSPLIKLSSTDRDFIKEMQINEKTYTKENSVINNWNWKIAQAASCGPEDDPHFQKPLFLINDSIQAELDLANEIIAKGEKQSEEEKILISDGDGKQFMQKGGVRYPYHPYHPTSKTDIKIINFVNESKQKIEMNVNDTPFTLTQHDKYSMQVKSNFLIKNLKIDNYFFTEDKPEIQWFNAIIQKIFPGHFCNININNEFLDALGNPWKQEVTFVNITDKTLKMSINDSQPFALSSQKEEIQAIEESCTPRTEESISPREEGSLSPRTPKGEMPLSPRTPRGRRIKVLPISHTLKLMKDLNGIYVKTLTINENSYTNDNKAVQALNKRIATLEFFGNKIELDNTFLEKLQENQAQASVSSSSSTPKGHQRIRSRSMLDNPTQAVSPRRISNPTPISSSGSKNNVPPLTLKNLPSTHQRLKSITQEEESTERSPRKID